MPTSGKISHVHRKSYDWRFFLDELELSRLHKDLDTVFEEALKAAESKTESRKIIVEVVGGTRYQFTSLDDVMSSENAGPQTIASVIFHFKAFGAEGYDRENPEVVLFVEFSNLDHPPLNDESHAPAPVRIAVIGPNRVWVKSTASILDERVTKTKRLSFGGSRHLEGLHVGMASMIVLGILAIPSQRELIEKIKNDYIAGAFKNTDELILATLSLRGPEPSVISAAVAVAIIMISILVIPRVWTRCATWIFPTGVFSWGDQLAVQRRKKALISYIVGSLLIGGLVIGLLVNYVWAQLQGKAG